MAYRKRTLRQMPPVTRKFARLTGEVVSLGRQLKAMVPEIHDLEEKDMARAEEVGDVLKRMTQETKKEDK